MKVINNSDEYSSYTREQHIENLVRLAKLTKQANELGTGAGGVDQMMAVAIKTASDAGLSAEDIATHSQRPLEEVERLRSEQ